jgi:hypothetical protein
MTIEKLKEEHLFDTTYAINEITGELIAFTNKGTSITLIEGDSRKPSVLCQMLFDEGAINDAWSPISDEEGVERHMRHFNAHADLSAASADKVWHVVGNSGSGE